MANDSIGEFEFITLTGKPPVRQTIVEADHRPGVDGNSLWQSRVSAEPFVMTSMVDCESLTHADQLINEYAELIDGDPVTMKYAGVDYSTHYKVAVQRVELVHVGPILACVGNLINSPSEAQLVCRWYLVPKEIEEEEA